MENENFIFLISFFFFFCVHESHFLTRDHASCNHANGGYQRGCWIALLTVHICSSLTLSAWLISDQHTNSFKSHPLPFLSPRGNKIFMHIPLWHGLMSAVWCRSWHQHSRVRCSSWQLVLPSYMPVLCGALQMCLFSESQAQTVKQPGACSRPEQRSQVVKLIFFFFVHIADIPEALREDHLHGHTIACRLLRQASGRSPSCVHKLLAEIQFHDI